MMQNIIDKQELQQQLETSPLVVVYFTGSTCSACEVIKQKVEGILKDYPQVVGVEVNGATCVEVATAYGVYTLPTMLLFVEGKESIRVGKHIDLLDFEKRLARYRDMMV